MKNDGTQPQNQQSKPVPTPVSPELLQNAQPGQLFVNSHKAPLVSRAHDSVRGLWLHSPAMADILSQTDADLTQAAKDRGYAIEQVDWVRAARLTGDSRVWVYPTTEKDPEKIQVKRYRGKVTFNLRSLLEPFKDLVDIGYKERFEVGFAGEDSPVGAALVFDRTRVLERKQESKKKKKQSASTDTKK